MALEALDIPTYTSRPLAKRILDYHNQLASTTERQNDVKLWNLVIKYCRPDLALIPVSGDVSSIGGARGEGMYTSKVATDLDLASDGLSSQIVSEGLDWFRYRVKNEELAQDDIVQQWQQKCETHMYRVFSDTNFYPLCYPMFKNAISLGNAPMLIEEDVKARRPVCQNYNIGNIYYTVDKHGNVDTLHRTFWLTAEAAYQMFPESRAKLSDELLRCITREPTKRFEFIQGIYQRDHIILSGEPARLRNREYMSLYIQVVNSANNDSQKDAVIRVEGYHDKRYLCWRYMRDETYGRGVLGNAIVTVQQLHFANRDVTEASQLAVAGPVMADQGFQGRLRLNPKGVNWRSNPNQTIEPVYKKNDYPFGVDLVNRTENEIAELLNVSLLLLLTRSEKEMTAREATLKLQEKAALLGPRVRWLERDFLGPTHDIFWDIELRAGRLPEPPRVILQALARGELVNIETQYVGPLAQIQRAMFGSRRLEANLVTVEPIMKIDPNVIAKVDWVEVFERELDRGGWDQDTIRSDTEYQRIMGERQELQRAMQEAQLNKDNATAANKLMTGMQTKAA